MHVRWIVDVTYASEAGDVDVRHHIEELEDMQRIVEAGPDWHCIKDIRIVLHRNEGDTAKTLEAARLE